MNCPVGCPVRSCLLMVVLVTQEPKEMTAITQILKFLMLLTKFFFFFSTSLALRARDSSCNVNKGPLPNLMQGFMVTNHPPLLTDSERRPAKQGLKNTCFSEKQRVHAASVPPPPASRSSLRSSPGQTGGVICSHIRNTHRAHSTSYGLKRLGS